MTQPLCLIAFDAAGRSCAAALLRGGELLAERSGVLNLGVEGMMLFGAAVGYWVTQRVGGDTAVVLTLAIAGAAVGGAAMAAIHAFSSNHFFRSWFSTPVFS